jgi:nitrogen-specific signal transduction histidine kinase
VIALPESLSPTESGQMSSAPRVEQISEEVSAAEVIRKLADDLRQPLSSIAAIAYYVEMTLPAAQLPTQHHMRQLQELVDQTTSILKHAAFLMKDA